MKATVRSENAREDCCAPRAIQRQRRRTVETPRWTSARSVANARRRRCVGRFDGPLGESRRAAHRHSRARALALARARVASRASTRRARPTPSGGIGPTPSVAARRPPRRSRPRRTTPRRRARFSTPPPTTPPSRAPSPTRRPPRRVLVGPRRFNPSVDPDVVLEMARPPYHRRVRAACPIARASPTGTRSNPAEIARDVPRPGLQAPWTQPRPRPRASRRRVRRRRVRASASSATPSSTPTPRTDAAADASPPSPRSAASARTEPPRRVTLHVPAPGSRLDPRLAPEEARVRRRRTPESPPRRRTPTSTSRRARRARRRGRRRGRSRTTRTRREACRRRAHRPRETCGVGYVSHGGVRSRGDDARLVSSSPFFRMTRERRGCDQTPVDDPAAKIYDVGRVEAARDVSNDAEEEEEEEDDDDDDAEVFDEEPTSRGRTSSAPTSSPPTSSSPSSSSPSSSSRRVVDSDAFDPVFTAGCLALDAWASTADASTRRRSVFIRRDCVPTRRAVFGRAHVRARRVARLRQTSLRARVFDADDDAGGVTERRRTKRRRDGGIRARWEAFTRARARDSRGEGALEDVRRRPGGERASAHPTHRARHPRQRADALRPPSRARPEVSGRFRGGFRRTISGMISGTISTTIDHATIGETFVDAMALFSRRHRDVDRVVPRRVRRESTRVVRVEDAGRSRDRTLRVDFPIGVRATNAAKLRRRAGHYLYSLASREGGWRLSQDTHADALEASADAAFAGMPMDDAHAMRAMRAARRLVAAPARRRRPTHARRRARVRRQTGDARDGRRRRSESVSNEVHG